MKEEEEPVYEFILTTKYKDRTVSVFHKYFNEEEDDFEIQVHLIWLLQSLMRTQGYRQEHIKELLTNAVENYI
tara:strand:- start:422 stop:640 length:219 start_codon:yes stop_codon:yes gene_type:complete